MSKYEKNFMRKVKKNCGQNQRPFQDHVTVFGANLIPGANFLYQPKNPVYQAAVILQDSEPLQGD